MLPCHDYRRLVSDVATLSSRKSANVASRQPRHQKSNTALRRAKKTNDMQQILALERLQALCAAV